VTNQLRKNIFLLLLLYILIIVTGLFSVTLAEPDLVPGDIIIPASFFTIIALITLIIFFRGQTKDPESQTLHSLLAVGLKFLLELISALVWFIVAKKTTFSSVLIFFVLYLTLTLFSVFVILKTLKNKSL